MIQMATFGIENFELIHEKYEGWSNKWYFNLGKKQKLELKVDIDI